MVCEGAFLLMLQTKDQKAAFTNKLRGFWYMRTLAATKLSGLFEPTLKVEVRIMVRITVGKFDGKGLESVL